MLTYAETASCSTIVPVQAVPSSQRQEHITDSPAHELLSPYANLERLPRLTAEEEAGLLADLRVASRAPAAKARLIEGYLPRVLTLARCYDRRYRVITFDDLVQEGSLALMQAIDKCATMPITTSLSRYIGTVVRSAFARAIGTDAPIHMPNSTWHAVHKNGRAQQYAWMQTMRLDALRHAEGETFAETIPAPALLLPDGEQEQRRHEEQRRQLVTLLALLSERRRRALALRYGLDPADARCHSGEETARVLGLSLGAVYDAQRRAITTLRHAFEAASGCRVSAFAWHARCRRATSDDSATQAPDGRTAAVSPAAPRRAAGQARSGLPFNAGAGATHHRQDAQREGTGQLPGRLCLCASPPRPERRARPSARQSEESLPRA